MSKIYNLKEDKISSDSIICKYNNKYYTLSELLNVETGDLAITKISGNSTATGYYVKYGNIVMVNITILTTGTTDSGEDLFVGTISNFAPKINTILVGYVGVRPIIASFTTEKKITVRNASASSLGKNSSPSIIGTFLIN